MMNPSIMTQCGKKKKKKKKKEKIWHPNNWSIDQKRNVKKW